ncbi:uncharacterized protein BCR38DRAFT_407148 [Pseudomassariella vexata]|uniref:Uncharacterized protein n=1 Tax=Pseudomassariella vexata TaxID=1141098 RepID=A0A1Y2E6E8_9PEZI|nr:uncharacterized protein BCR38DRAFT_407148 [Pseudomassariella vexata]ORY67138.1 hypothetical protein BCR38DRAFT_407148 [Pseudomassariella vexata]
MVSLPQILVLSSQMLQEEMIQLRQNTPLPSTLIAAPEIHPHIFIIEHQHQDFVITENYGAFVVPESFEVYSFHNSEEFLRVKSGESVLEEAAVLDEFDIMYHADKKGNSFLAKIWSDRSPSSKAVGMDWSQIQPPNAPPTASSNEMKPKMNAYFRVKLVYTCFDSPQTVVRHAFNDFKLMCYIEFQDESIEITSMDCGHCGTALEHLSKICIQGAVA